MLLLNISCSFTCQTRSISSHVSALHYFETTRNPRFLQTKRIFKDLRSLCRVEKHDHLLEQAGGNFRSVPQWLLPTREIEGFVVGYARSVLRSLFNAVLEKNKKKEIRYLPDFRVVLF